MTQTGRVVLITGASSGIGEATARTLAGHGYPVVLAARRVDPLRRITSEIEDAGGRAAYIVGDLSQEEQRLQLAQAADEPHGPVEVLINNAGFGWYGYAASMPWTTGQQMLKLNVIAATHLAQLFLVQFLERGVGHLINVGSIAGSLPSQGVALYSGSKSFLDAYTTALHRELAGTRIKASLLRLGAVRTPFYQVLQGISEGRRVPVERFTVSAAVVGRAVHRLLRRPRRVLTLPHWMVVVPWVELTLGWMLDRIGPRLLQLQGYSWRKIDESGEAV